ncbi:heavy-metal-associated domain-containing protein [uncultured Proteiniphilum sp.]|uniref:heavy-metal-associated domain-containing protein n=1 Tax=uncultured Proteiniphilum sp. TaxID=497637 RepID=UPI00260299EB|nr:heavy-metal-associated domain-containing protein [uncultured Proteiniphilum sp.]
MKKIIALFTVIALSTGIGFAQKQQKKEKKQEVVEFTLNEVICPNCKRKIDNNIAFEKGVTGITYGEDGNTVQVKYRTDRTDPEKLQSAFEKVKLEVVEAKPVEQPAKEK